MREDRAVATSLNYVLTLAIATVLVTGLLYASTNYVDDRRGEVVRDELTIIGQQVAADLARADRLVTAADSDGTDLTVGTNQTFPERVAGRTYRVGLDPSNERLVVEAPEQSVRVTVGLELRTDLGESSAGGGVVRVVYVATGADTGHLEVRNG